MESNQELLAGSPHAGSHVKNCLYNQLESLAVQVGTLKGETLGRSAHGHCLATSP